MSIPWLRVARMRKQGPPFLRLSRRAIRYRRADLDDWLASRRVSTTDTAPTSGGE
jgi:hypothetical protein